MSKDDANRRRFTSFSELFQARRMPIANRDFVVQAFAGIEIVTMIEMISYVKIVRSDGERDLHLYNTLIGGYDSETEALELSGARQAYPSKSRPGTWWVWLPVRTDPTPGATQRYRVRADANMPSWMRRPCPKCENLMNEARECTYCPPA